MGGDDVMRDGIFKLRFAMINDFGDDYSMTLDISVLANHQNARP